MNILKTHFPNKQRFKVYLKLFLPMLIGSTLYALNGFVDNFMVGHLEQGGTALSAVNSWTNIIMGIFIGLSAAGSVINARYYFSGDYERAQSMFKFRLLFGVSVGLVFALIAWTTPDTLIKVFLKEPDNPRDASYLKALDNAREYMRLITLSWIFIGISSQMGNSLREIGHGKASMYWGYLTLTTNVSLNAILMYGFNFGVSGAAIASDAARVVAISFGIYWLLSKDTKISFKIWTIFKFDTKVIKDFFTKWYLFISFSIVTLFITFRNFFYDEGYKVSDHSSLGVGVGAMTVLALTGAIMNIFTTTFSATGAMSANVVGKELAAGREEEALVRAKELKGFMTLMAFILALALALFAIAVPYMSFLSERKYDSNGVLTFDNKENLIHVRNSLWVICFYYPIWIWFTASYRTAATGKKGFWFSFVDIMVSGPIQLAWIAGLAYGVVPHWEYSQSHFFVTYALFFASDFLKLIGMEILFYKFKWNLPINKQKQVGNIAKGNDEIDDSEIIHN